MFISNVFNTKKGAYELCLVSERKTKMGNTIKTVTPMTKVLTKDQQIMLKTCVTTYVRTK